MDSYFGDYRRFETVSKKDAGALLNADNLVGDVYDIEFKTEEGQSVAWIRNRFGGYAGFFDAATSRELRIMHARGWVLKALLSYVAYTDSPEPGRYWGEAAVVAYDPRYSAAFENYTATLGKKLMEGVRPVVELGKQGFERVIAENGAWISDQTLPQPVMEKGTVIMKKDRSFNDKMVEAARAKNKGCYVMSWLFMFALAAGVVFALKSCGVF